MPNIRINRSVILMLLLLILMSSCRFDRFDSVNPTFVSDKMELQIGDEFNLTLSLTSIELKEIRFFDDFRNFAVYFSHRYPCEDGFKGSCNHFLEENRIIGSEKPSISKYSISEDSPFEKTFKCEVSSDESNVIFKISEIGYSVLIPRSQIDENEIIGFYGLCLPIRPHITDPIEDYTSLQELRLNVK